MLVSVKYVEAIREVGVEFPSPVLFSPFPCGSFLFLVFIAWQLFNDRAFQVVDVVVLTFEMLGDESRWLSTVDVGSVVVQALFEGCFCFTNILYPTLVAFNEVDDVFGGAACGCLYFEYSARVAAFEDASFFQV
jgi:hypothetical protein